MITSTNVADFFISLAKDYEADTITNLRVNKLVYFAQAWFLARYGKPLFGEEIEAWDYGPVIPSIYQKYKSYGKNNIDYVSSEYSSSLFSTDELNTLIDVYSYYSKFSTTELVNITHQKGSPWDITLKNKERENDTISLDSIKEYYQSQTPLQSFILPDWLHENIETPKRNANGVLILSAEEWEEDDA